MSASPAITLVACTVFSPAGVFATRDRILIENHASTGQSDDIESDGRAAVSLLGGGPGTEFLPRVSGAHHYFCSHDSSVTAWANWIRPDVRVHAFLGRCRNHSTEGRHVSSRRGDCARVRRGLNRRIQFVVRPFGLGYGAEGIRAGHPGSYDAASHISSRAG